MSAAAPGTGRRGRSRPSTGNKRRTQPWNRQGWAFHGRAPWHYWLDAGVLLVLLGLGVLGFGPAFGGDPYFLVAGLGGVLLGLGLAAAGAYWRLGLITMVGGSVVAYLLFGSVLAAPRESLLGFIPSIESFRGLLVGVVFSWKQMLTLAAPVGTSVEVLVVPYLVSLVCAVVAGTLAWRLRQPYWTMLPVLVLFLASIIFGTSEALQPVVRGILLAAGAVAWLAYRRDALRRVDSGKVSANRPEADLSVARSGRNRRLAMGAGVVVVAGLLTMVGAPMLTAADHRQVLRDAIIPPPDLHDLATPLSNFRKYVKDDKDKVLFSVSGLPKDGRVRLAALDDYDGVVFKVDESSSGSFIPVGDPKSLNSSLAGTSSSTLDFAIDQYSGVWIPGARVAQGIVYSAADGSTHRLYLNKDSDTALNMDSVSKGDSYSVSVAFPAVDTAKLAGANFGSVTLPKVANVPQVVDTKANDFVGTADTPLKKVEALSSTLQRIGKFSNGLDGQTPSTSGHGAARITRLLSGKEMVGDDEQYAVAMALMARHLGIPARVVMGFYLDAKDPNNGAPKVDIKGANVHAWVEVNFDGVGWVPFDATPDKDHVPNPPDPQDASSPKPQVLQPPPPPQEPADLPPDSAPEALDADGKKQNPWAFWGPILAALGLAAIPLAIVLVPLLIIAALKARRRKKRLLEGAPAQRVGGGWSEVISFATDLGAAVNPKHTRRETASTLAAAFPRSQGTTTMLAHRADASIFGAGDPSEEEVADYWKHVDSSLKDMSESVPYWHRQRARFSPRSLLADAGLAMGIRPTMQRQAAPPPAAHVNDSASDVSVPTEAGEETVVRPRPPENDRESKQP